MATPREIASGLTQKRLKQLLRYDRRTGVFVWRIDRGGKAKAGSLAGWDDDKGYRIITVDMVEYAAHRLAFLYVTGSFPLEEVDHKNLKPGDNRWRNLRHASRLQNCANRAVRSDNVARLRGVTKRKWSFDARIMHQGKHHHLGCFKTARAAHTAYRAAAKRFYGEYHRA